MSLSLGAMRILADAVRPIVFDLSWSRALSVLALLAALWVLAFVVLLLAVVMRPLDAVQAVKFVLLLSVVR